jgi:hypothetical protein
MNVPQLQNQVRVTNAGICLWPKALNNFSLGHRPWNRIAYDQGLKARFGLHPGPDLAVIRAFSAGPFCIPIILGRCPRRSMNAAPLARKKLERRNVPTL